MKGQRWAVAVLVLFVAIAAISAFAADLLQESRRLAPSQVEPVLLTEPMDCPAYVEGAKPAVGTKVTRSPPGRLA